MKISLDACDIFGKTRYSATFADYLKMRNASLFYRIKQKTYKRDTQTQSTKHFNNQQKISDKRCVGPSVTR